MWHFPIATSTSWGSPDWPRNLNFSNLPVRTRMPGGVAGGLDDLSRPLCRSRGSAGEGWTSLQFGKRLFKSESDKAHNKGGVAGRLSVPTNSSTSPAFHHPDSCIALFLCACRAEEDASRWSPVQPRCCLRNRRDQRWRLQ